jgi:hypothetical protein
MTDWWRPDLSPELSQGDVLIESPVALVCDPIVHLQKGTGKGNKTIWFESDFSIAGSDGKGNFLAKGKMVAAMVLSRDCEIDKTRTTSRITVAPIYLLTSIPEAHRLAVLRQDVIAMLPIPECSGISDSSYVDFRSITTIPRSLVSRLKRTASLSDEAKLRLQTQIVKHFTHRDPTR